MDLNKGKQCEMWRKILRNNVIKNEEFLYGNRRNNVSAPRNHHQGLETVL